MYVSQSCSDHSTETYIQYLTTSEKKQLLIKQVTVLLCIFYECKIKYFYITKIGLLWLNI